jgi:hypothetical protein
MTNEAETDPQEPKQQQGQQEPTGSVKPRTPRKPFTGKAEPEQSAGHFQEESIPGQRFSA